MIPNTNECSAGSPKGSVSPRNGGFHPSPFGLFPRQNHLPSPSSSFSSLNSHEQTNHDLIALHNKLSLSTRFAFTDLVITILRLDFYKKSDVHSINFCEKAIGILFKWGDLPPKTQSSLRLHLEHDHPFNEDIGSLIMSIKSDPIFGEYGFIPILGSFLLTILVGGDYDARFRVLIRHVSALLGIDWDIFEEFESTLGDRLIDEYEESLENQQIREKKTKIRRLKRYAIIGAATGLGGVLIGVTGGLAAPFIVSSLSALTATTIFAGLTTTATAAIFGSLFGVAGAGLSGYRMQKRVGEIEEFLIERLTEDDKKSLHCVLCVSGWIDEPQAFRHQWRHLWLSKEQYTLKWESMYLEELGKSIEYFVSFVVSYAVQRSLMETVLASLVSAVAWPLILLGSSSIIDNPWNICTHRAAEVGKHLAEMLLTRSHGHRPITLIGFSLGARVIFHCLLEMSKRKPNSLGIIEDIILLGAPVSASPTQWHRICSVVSGRVINGYCNTDWLLRFLYRTMSIQFVIAGTGPVKVKNERKIVNFNLSHIVKGHLDYAKKLTEVLKAVGVRVTPLSQDSQRDLLEEQEEFRECSSILSTSKLDETSTIVEQLKGFEVIDDSETFNVEEGGESGLTFKNDPLEASKHENSIKRINSLASIETFHSAKSSMNDDEETLIL